VNEDAKDAMIEATVRGPKGLLSERHGPLRGRVTVEVYYDGHMHLDTPALGDELAALLYRALRFVEDETARGRAQRAPRILAPDDRKAW
jgi:hypothetical protein